ncbi:hypothetical protein AAE02nite_03170 [Adhaeribacter aerolatus]|uniref:DUF3999 domain-containing protein n=1 Tax=Adhaeribacter aerolatus TaxID=670289 RepID=A0A512ASG8_9BACT|nr:DUF3999 family protein [Adhaeribacter aerolatus]GEO02653.1 hypothetical protein AAE02nite_03170 [Adhaeribacter aerolatus]
MQKLAGILLSLLLGVQVAFGQEFRHQASLPPVATDGFYKIAVTPAVAAWVKNNLADIRLYDSARREVPYLLEREQPVQTRQLFRAYEIVQKTSVPGGNTTLVLRNPGRSKINNISLLLKNTNVRKKASLSGSNDARTWYGLEDQYDLYSLYSRAATVRVNLLNFPLSDYEYYQLIINDSTSAPLNILSAGYYDTFSESGKYTAVPDVQFSQTDSAELKQTFIFFRNPVPVFADKLQLEITGPVYYWREATLYAAQFRKKRRRKTYKTYEPVATFRLQSDQENAFTLNNFKSDDFYLVVNNQDSPPLRIKNIQFYFRNTYLIAPLQKGQAYHLAFGNEAVSPPHYDLAYFKDSISAALPIITPTRLRALAAPDEKKTATIFKDKNIIWAAILLVIGLLGFMTYRLLQETGKKPQ